MKCIAHYWRHHQHHTLEFDTIKEAKAFLDYGEEWGELSTECIETPRGYISGNDLAPIYGTKPEGCEKKNVGKKLRFRKE